jgi:hypothetical protein
MRSHLAPTAFSFCVDNLRNSSLQRALWVLRAILDLRPKGITNLKVLDHNLLRSE